MQKREAGIGLFLILVSLLLCCGAFRLGLGEWRNPGPGFFPFLAGLLIIGFSSVIIVTSFKRSPRVSSPASRLPLLTWRSALIFGSLLAFGLWVERAGFFVCTFFMVLLVLKMTSTKKWSFLFLVALFTCLGIYCVFNYSLEVRLPLGILGWMVR